MKSPKTTIPPAEEVHLAWKGGLPCYGGKVLKRRGKLVELLKMLVYYRKVKNMGVRERVLMAEIWQNANPEKAKASLRTTMARLREATGEAWQWTKTQLPEQSKNGCYSLNLLPVLVDLPPDYVPITERKALRIRNAAGTKNLDEDEDQ
jgi:two-component SAPR family response regulator